MSAATAPLKPTLEPRFPLHAVSVACAALLAVHIVLRLHYGSMKDGLDAIALGLVVLGVSPWIAPLIRTLEFAGFKLNFQEIQARVEKQGADIRQLQFLISNFLPLWELKHLKKLASGEQWIVDLNTTSPDFEGEIRHLRSVGFINHTRAGGIKGFIHGDPREKNCQDYFEITDTGREYLGYWEASNKKELIKPVETVV